MLLEVASSWMQMNFAALRRGNIQAIRKAGVAQPQVLRRHSRRKFLQNLAACPKADKTWSLGLLFSPKRSALAHHAAFSSTNFSAAL